MPPFTIEKLETLQTELHSRENVGDAETAQMALLRRQHNSPRRRFQDWNKTIGGFHPL